MTSAESYRATAAAMRKRAAAGGTPEHCAAWARMAMMWEVLANDVEAAAQLVRATTDQSTPQDD